MISPIEEISRTTVKHNKMEDVLKYIVSGQIYNDIPSGEADFAELGGYVYPARMEKIVDMAKEVINI